MNQITNLLLKVEGKSMLEIQREIYRKIEELPDGLRQEIFNKLIKIKKNKAVYIEFYKSLSEDE